MTVPWVSSHTYPPCLASIRYRLEAPGSLEVWWGGDWGYGGNFLVKTGCMEDYGMENSQRVDQEGSKIWSIKKY